MFLVLRYILYGVFSSLGTLEWVYHDAANGNLVINIDGLTNALPYYTGFLGTVGLSRIAKVKGWLT